ncbi:STAS domain-containing protein [Alkalicoccus halolimnae]|uniref:STAS domain-containing protein n=1 Tax=Alkalicoccus halolimnae TaxID=1667239 RepID=A0A5C7F961_9BACI|nr:STAS domain-containing protein [Alkalicoccus halolimnae]TXF86573.1 STAS domain-containing protein [Alkalicoccus halolimnae]
MASGNEYMKYIGEKISSMKYVLAEEISLKFQSFHEINFNKMPETEIKEHIAELVEQFADGFITADVEKGKAEVHKWGRGFGEKAAILNLSPDKAMLVVPILRKVVYKHMRKEFTEGKQTFSQYYEIADTINPLIDQAIYSFTQAYVEKNEKNYQEAKDEISELSVPVVPITREVAILPVIGSVDSKRAELLLTQALSKGNELKLSTLIVDLSGVQMIDTYVAQNLFQLNDALRVIGIRVIFSGLRPELAQTVVNLGISFENMTVVNSLPQALAETGLAVGEDKRR